MRGKEGATSSSAKIKYDQALDELKLIHPSRTVPEIEADIVRTTDLKTHRQAQRRESHALKHERSFKRIVNTLPTRSHRDAIQATTSIATYLASFGVAISVATLAQWLNLVPVLALELGSALAMVLVSVLPSA